MLPFSYHNPKSSTSFHNFSSLSFKISIFYSTELQVCPLFPTTTSIGVLRADFASASIDLGNVALNITV